MISLSPGGSLDSRKGISLEVVGLSCIGGGGDRHSTGANDSSSSPTRLEHPERLDNELEELLFNFRRDDDVGGWV